MKQPKKKEYEEFQQYLYNKAHGYIWTPDTLELICRMIRALEDRTKASVPIIAVSANVQEKDRNAALEAGMDGFTEKPIFVDKLFEAMKQYLSEDS